MRQPGEDLLDVQNLKKYYPIAGGLLSRAAKYVKAVDGVSFTVKRGEALGLVGESGCGKTTLAKTILKLSNPTSGKIVFEGREIQNLSRGQMRSLRKDMQVIFQDPYGSLDPRMRVDNIIGEPLEANGVRGDSKHRRVRDLAGMVGLSEQHLNRYPHEFSGGQRQRIGIARALALSPKMVVCDEPVSALDVSIQSQILNLLADLQEQMGLTYIFIAHGLSVVRYVSDRVGVMYLGKIVELGKVSDIYNTPKHPYTRAIISAIPVADPEAARERILLQGDVPSPVDPPGGCRFHTRCPVVEAICRDLEPELRDVGGGQLVACHMA